MDTKLIDYHRTLVAQIKRLQDEELKIRLQIYEQEFGGIVDKGTHRLPLSDNEDLRLVVRYNISVDESGINENAAKFRKAKVPQNVFKYKPSLDNKVYETLTPKQKAVVDEVITVRPGTPSIDTVSAKRRH